MKKIIIISLFVLAYFSGVYAQVSKVPANPNPFQYSQPDSTKITLILKGDENLHWAESIDGYTLLSSEEGGYEYAKLDKSENLINSGKLAHEENLRTKNEKRFLKKIPKGLFFSESQVAASKKIK